MTDPGLPLRRLVLGILIVALGTQPVFLLGAAFVQMERDIGISPTALGLLTAAFFLTAAMTSTPLGRLVERIGWRAAIRINSVASAAVLVSIAAFARTTVVLAALMVVAGAVYGFANPAANKAIAERVAPARRGLLFGMKHAGIPTSTLLAGIAVPVIVLTAGWPAAFAVAALLLPVVWLLIPREHEEVVAVAGADEPARGAIPMTVRQLAALAMGAALASWSAVALGTFLVASAVDTGMSEGAAGILLFAGSAASITARMTAGAVADRIHGRGFAGLIVLMSAGAVTFLVLPAAAGVAFVLLVVMAFTTGWGWPGLMTFTVVNANADSAAASSGITQAGVFLGAGAAPIILGAIIDTWSFGWSWLAVSAALATAALIVTSVDRRVRSRAATN